MSFNGREGTFIPIDDAATMTAAWRDKGNAIKGVFFGKDKLNDLLTTPGAMGIRMYFAINNNATTLVCVATDADENDILGSEVALEEAVPCPNRCGANNALNSDE